MKCCFLLFDGFSNMVLANALEPLRAARDLSNGSNISWFIATTANDAAISSSGIRVSADVDIDTLENLDFLFLISGYGFRDHIDKHSMAKLQRLRRKSQHVVGLDAGAWLMAEAGFLDGHHATIHWQELDQFRETFPSITVQNRNFVFSDAMITCGDASAVFEAMIEIIRGQFGDATAFDVSNLFMFDFANTADQQPGRPYKRAAGSDILRAAMRAMSMNLETPMRLPDLAMSIGVSLSTLNREFQAELQCSPGRHYLGVRLNHARRLAFETRLPNLEIAQRSGFSSASVLCRAFSAHFGETISAVRRSERLFL